MLKKTTLFIFFTLTIQIFGMGTYENSFTSTNQSQINHIKAEMRHMKQAFKSELLRIKIAQKASITSYQTFAAIFDKILASNNFTTKLNDTVTKQFDAIVNNNMAFSSITEFNLSDFFPNTTINEFGKKLFSAMANKVFYLELGKRLAQKLQELKMTSALTPMSSS